MLSDETRELVRSIAKADKISFRQAMLDYQYLRKTIKAIRLRLVIDQRRSGKGDVEGELREIENRIFRTCHTLKITLRESVDSFNPCKTDYGVRTVEIKTRKCRHPKCSNPTLVNSYYYCKKHQVELETDDGAPVYCLPVNRGDVIAINAGIRRYQKKMGD